MENFSKEFQKQKKETKHMKKLKIEYLLSFTVCRKVLGKMPELYRLKVP